MDNETFIKRIQEEMPKLAAEYERHVQLHRKNLRIWLFAIVITAIFAGIIIFLPLPICLN